MANKYAAFGAQFQRLISATWTAVAGISKIGDFAVMRDTIEVTTHDSTNFREYIGSLADVEEFDITMVFDHEEASHEYFRDQVTNLSNPAGETFRTVLSTTAAETWEFTAIVTKFSLSERDIEGRVEATVTFKPTGAPDFDPA